MKKLLKIAAIALLPLIGLLVLGVVLAWVYIDTLAERGVERGATYALGVPTALGSADVGVLSGSVELSGLEVSNPEGFSADHFLTLDSTEVDVSLGSLTSDVVEVPTLVLSGIDVRLERTLEGANYKVILDNLKRFEGEEKKEPEPEGKKFVIRSVQIRDVKVHVDAVPVEGAIGELATAEVTVDEVTLHDVGSGAEPMSLAELTAVILKAILASAVDIGGDILPEDVLGELGDQLADMLDLSEMGVGSIEGLTEKAAELLGTPVEEAAEEVQEAIEGVTEQAQEAVEGAQETIKKEADKARERLGGLLPGQKKQEPKEEPKDPG
ncbi:MAG: hypothetical protein ACIAQU_10200 [Phycisphaerales bacterium JB064]